MRYLKNVFRQMKSLKTLKIGAAMMRYPGHHDTTFSFRAWLGAAFSALANHVEIEYLTEAAMKPDIDDPEGRLQFLDPEKFREVISTVCPRFGRKGTASTLGMN